MDLEAMWPTRPKAFNGLRIFPRRRSSAGRAIIDDVDVPDAEAGRTGCGRPSGRCTIWATRCPAGRESWRSATRNITALPAATTSTPTCWIWPCPTPTTPSASCTPRSAWWSRTGCPIEPPVGTSGGTTAFSFPSPRFRTGSRRGEKRAAESITHEYLDRVLADFSGYIAADELYDGPYCVLSIVDNRTFQRLLYEVLDHDPTEEDITRFFQRFQEALTARGLRLQGITTDGSALYPTPIVKVFGTVPHQICQFHILAELNKAVLKAVAQVRRDLKATVPKLGRGRPSAAKRRLAARKKRIESKIADLFEHRHLFVQRHLSVAERQTLQRITRGQPALRTLRQIMDQAYGLFDRRCRTETALAKLARLRQRVARFQHLRQTLKKLFSPNLEKALTFLDDSLLPATSNAVERGNRRHRKMQKTVYRVRTEQTIRCRIALDMQRDLQAPARRQTTATLHQQRCDTG